MNPYAVIENEDGTYTWDTNTLNEEFYMFHADSLQKGLWLAGHKFMEMDQKYHCGAIIYDGWGSSPGLSLAYSFNEWIVEKAEYGAKISDSDKVSQMFSDINNDIIYLIGKGVVTDEINDEFTFFTPEEGNPFKMTITEKKKEGETETEEVTVLDVTVSGKKYNFGTPDDEGVYPYVAEYVENDHAVVWTINVPVETTKRISLSFELTIDEDAYSGEHFTNKAAKNGDEEKSALLVFTSSEGRYVDQNYYFPRPTVTYDNTASYKVEHYQQQLDGTYTLVEGDTETLTATVKTQVEATAKTYEGFALNLNAPDTVKEGVVKGDDSLVLKLYYDREAYTVTYVYDEPVPANAPAVPQPHDYKYGETVPAADVPEMSGYIFSGWEGEVTTMPANDVTVHGSWVEKGHVVITPANNTKVYSEADPELTATVTGLEGDDTIDYSLTREPGEDVGEYVISVVDYPAETDKYTVEVKTALFTITPKPVVVTADDKTKVYGEEDEELTAVVTGLVGKDTVEYELSRKEGEDVGEYTITPAGKAEQGNYTVTYETGIYTITPKAIVVTADDKTKVYGEEDEELTATVTGLVGKDTVKYELSRKSGEDVGKYAITPTGEAEQGNYTVTYENGTYTITPKEVVVTADDKTKVYGEKDEELTAVVTGLVGEDAVKYELSREAGENVGEYVITPADEAEQGNYTVTYKTGTYTITPKTIVVKADDKTKVYGEEDEELTVTVTGLVSAPNGATSAPVATLANANGIVYEIAREPGENVGEYTITPTGEELQGNYKVTFETGTYTITPRTVTVKADDKSKVCGEPDEELTAVVNGLLGEDTVAYELSREPGEEAGEYVITPAGEDAQGNYNVVYETGIYTITANDTPDTGDRSSIDLWAILFAQSMILALGAAMKLRKRYY